ncbi:MAG: LCP family protein [Candidatus Limnocylindria bacterium]
MEDTQPHRRPTDTQARRLRRAEPKARRPIRWRRWIALIAFAVIAVVVVGAVLLWQRAAAFNDAVSTQSAMSMRLFGPFSPERVNILLLGYSDESREGAYLSDSMNVLSIDNTTATTSLIAIPRDIWVEGIPEVPQNMKINEAFRIGFYEGGVENAAELAAKAVTHVTGMEMHGWITLDFQGFRRMVGAVGGITIENPRAFRYTWVQSQFEAGEFKHRFSDGTLALNGRRALDYARSRYTNRPEESSDFARSIRQQRVLNALRPKIGLGELPAMTEALDGHLLTNLSVLDLGSLSGKIDVDRRIELSGGEVLQATTNTNGQYILIAAGQTSTSDYQPIHRHIEEELSAPVTGISPSMSDEPG